MANFQPFISTKSAQKSLCSQVRELEGVHARIPQLYLTGHPLYHPVPDFLVSVSLLSRTGIRHTFNLSEKENNIILFKTDQSKAIHYVVYVSWIKFNKIKRFRQLFADNTIKFQIPTQNFKSFSIKEFSYSATFTNML